MSGIGSVPVWQLAVIYTGICQTVSGFNCYLFHKQDILTLNVLLMKLRGV